MLFATLIFVLLWMHRIQAIVISGASSVPTLLANFTATQLQNLSVTEFDDLTSPTSDETARRIHCLPDEPYNLPTTIPGCRVTLNSFRNFQDFNKVQEFVSMLDDSRSRPRVPSRPPYVFENPGESTCAASITSYGDGLSAWFSFREARQVMQNIIQECEDEGGRGGFMEIGMDRTRRRPIKGWLITVVGRDPRQRWEVVNNETVEAV